MSYLKRAIACACLPLLAQLAFSETVSGSKQTFLQQITDPLAAIRVLSGSTTNVVPKPVSARIEAIPGALSAFFTPCKSTASPVESAMNLLGSKYRWGGLSSRAGFDCSGFVKIVFSKQGIDLPRTSGQQAYVGIPVKGSDLKPGDLVFFHTSRRSRITHVGIYAGNGKFIHAANTRKGVRMDSLSEAYYRQRLVTARRVRA